MQTGALDREVRLIAPSTCDAHEPRSCARMVSLQTPTSTLDRVRREIDRKAFRAHSGIYLFD